MVEAFLGEGDGETDGGRAEKGGREGWDGWERRRGEDRVDLDRQ